MWASVILQDFFWLIDKDKPIMGYLYEAMDRAK
jgi:hypothetical protein